MGREDRCYVAKKPTTNHPCCYFGPGLEVLTPQVWIVLYFVSFDLAVAVTFSIASVSLIGLLNYTI